MNAWLRAMVRLLRGGEVRRRRPNPVLALYRWRWELALIGVVAALGYLGYTVGWSAPLGVVLTSAAVVAVWPPAQWAVRDRCRAVVVQHRLRTAFHELGLTTWAGRAPAVVWTSAGRDPRVLVVCPAGIGVTELSDVREQLASTCWAADVLVERHPRYANVVVLTVVTHVAAGGRPDGSRP